MKLKTKEHLIFFISMFLMMIGIFSYSPMLTIVSGILLALPTIKYLKSKIDIRKIRYLAVLSVILLCVGCSSSPSEESTTIVNIETTTQIATTTQETKEVSTIETVSSPSLQETSVEQTSSSNTVSEMKVHFIDVGQGDCELIESDGHFMLIDAGENDKGELVSSYLKGIGVEKLDYVIGTHPHSDYIGGLDVVINNFDIETVIIPEKEHTTKTFEDLLTAIENKNLEITFPEVGDTYNIGNASFTIIAPNKEYGNELNDWSVGIKLINGENSFVFTGDAETESESDIVNNGIDISADVLKLGHHGSSTSSSIPFLEAVKPTYAIISCGKDNSYGHPHKETVTKLNDYNIQTFRTDEQGTIIATSDGTNITWNCEPSTTIQNASVSSQQTETTTIDETTLAETTTIETTQEITTTQVETTTVEETTTVQETTKKEIIVHITNTGSKYHSSGCQYLRKSDIETTLKDAKSRGLTPCSKCNPPK